MKLAVLLLHCSDAPRVTTLTREWVHRAVGHVAGYFIDQSGSRENMEFRVFDWFQLPFTSEEWNGFGFLAGPQVQPVVAQGLGVDLSPFDHFALVIDKADAVLAAVSPLDPRYVHVGAQSLDPALLAHEFGHFYGAGHSNLASVTGPVEYGDNFCVMGVEGAKYSFIHEPLNIIEPSGAVTTAFSDSGPGMVIPSLMACGWLDVTRHGVDMGPLLRSQPWQMTVELAPLRGAPIGGEPVVPVCAYADGVTGEPLTVEYRRRDGWDRAMPDSGGGGNGWVVVHTASVLGPGTSCLQVASMPAVAGATSYLSPGAVGFTVAGIDEARKTVMVRVEVERHPSLYAAIWEQSSGTAWQARHGLTAAQYQQTFTELVAQGYRLIDVTGYTVGGQDRYAAVWEQTGGPAWLARHGLTSDQYQQAFMEMAAQGYRPVKVSGYAVGGEARYAAIWEQRGGPAWQARHGLTADQYQATFDDLIAQGFRLVKVSGYAVGGQDRYAAIWEQSDGLAWQARHGLTADQYQATFDDLVAQGFRLVDVSGYAVGGEARYAAIWQQSDGPAWQARHGLTDFRYQQSFHELLGLGYRLTRVSGFNPHG